MSLELKANAHAPGSPLAHFWNVCVGAGRAAEGLRATWLEQMQLAVQHCRFRYVRFHGIFHDDMFVYRVIDGVEVFNFQYVDDLFDRLLDLGIKPFVELGFCPGDLATEKETVFWWKGHGSPPKDYTKWAELVRRLVVHLIERYGVDEVLTWYFEVWNEPNLGPFFRGTKTQYFELYKITVRTIKGIEPRLRVGGPSTSNFVPDGRFEGETEDKSQHRVVTQAKDLNALDWKPVWLEQFLTYCCRQKLPVDFISVHPYPTDWALDEHGTGMKFTRAVDATPRDLALLRRLIDGSVYPNAEIHLTEWNSSSSSRDHAHDHLPAATYVVKANLEAIGQVDSLAYWTFTDVFEEQGGGPAPFHGGFGLINYQGIVKPTFHAYRFLAALGDELLAQSAGAVITRHRSSGKLSALVYHYPPEMPLTVPASFDAPAKAEETLALGRAEIVTVTLTGLRPRAAIVIETLGKEAGNVIADWKAMGTPESLSREQAAHLRRSAMATTEETMSANADGVFTFNRPIEPWSVILIREV